MGVCIHYKGKHDNIHDMTIICDELEETTLAFSLACKRIKNIFLDDFNKYKTATN